MEGSSATGAWRCAARLRFGISHLCELETELDFGHLCRVSARLRLGHLVPAYRGKSSARMPQGPDKFMPSGDCRLRGCCVPQVPCDLLQPRCLLRLMRSL